MQRWFISNCCQSVIFRCCAFELQLSYDGQTLFGHRSGGDCVDFLDLTTFQLSHLSLPLRISSCTMLANGELLINAENEFVHYKPEYMTEFENRACMPLRQAIAKYLVNAKLSIENAELVGLYAVGLADICAADLGVPAPYPERSKFFKTITAIPEVKIITAPESGLFWFRDRLAMFREENCNESRKLELATTAFISIK